MAILFSRVGNMVVDQASLRDAPSFVRIYPALETPGYCQLSLQDRRRADAESRGRYPLPGLDLARHPRPVRPGRPHLLSRPEAYPFRNTSGLQCGVLRLRSAIQERFVIPKMRMTVQENSRFLLLRCTRASE